MDLSEVLLKIKETSGDEAFNLISGKITELNEESKTRRTKNKALSDVNDSIVDKFGLNSEEDVLTQLDGIFKSKDQKNQDSLSDVEKLTMQVQDLSTKFSESQKLASDNAIKAISAKRDSLIQKALSETNVSKELLSLVSTQVEKMTSINGDEITFSDGEKTYNSVSEGVSSYIDSNPHLQTMQNTGGSGEQNNGNQQGLSNQINQSEFGSNIDAIARGEKTIAR